MLYLLSLFLVWAEKIYENQGEEERKERNFLLVVAWQSFNMVVVFALTEGVLLQSFGADRKEIRAALP